MNVFLFSLNNNPINTDCNLCSETENNSPMEFEGNRYRRSTLRKVEDEGAPTQYPSDEKKLSIDMGNQADFDDCLSGRKSITPTPPIIGHPQRANQ